MDTSHAGATGEERAMSDDHWFDRLNKALVRDTPRRTVLGAIAMVASVSCGVAPGIRAAKNRKKKGKKGKKPCRGTTKRCGRRCIPRTNCCTSAECDQGEVCRNGRCAECTAATDCPSPPTCEQAVCQDGRCATVSRPAGFPCEADPPCVINKTCDGSGQCQGGAPDDDRCVTTNPCQRGRCDPASPLSDQDGCVFDPLTGGATVCGVGACRRSVQRCLNGVEQPCVPGQPSAEVCNGIDDDCDGLIDDGACPVGQRCEAGGCCIVDGFQAEHECADDGECCSGNCATHDFGATCRPAGCLPTGGACTPGPQVCCSFTCSGTTCQ
jgi:hypothetical protein